MGMPHVKHTLIIANDCDFTTEHSNPKNVVGNIRGDVNGEARFQFALNTGFTLFGEHSIINKTVLIYESEGDNGKRLACGTISEESDISQIVFPVFLTKLIKKGAKSLFKWFLGG